MKKKPRSPFGQRLDAEFRSDFKRLYESAVETVCSTPQEAARAFKSAVTGEHGRLAGGLSFSANAEREVLHSKVVQRAVKILGSKAGDDHEVSQIVWQAIVTAITNAGGGDGEPLKMFITGVEALEKSELNVVAPNALLQLPESMDCLTVGPVSALSGEVAAAHLNAGKGDCK